jgi:hypothetical protein
LITFHGKKQAVTSSLDETSLTAREKGNKQGNLWNLSLKQ